MSEPRHSYDSVCELIAAHFLRDEQLYEPVTVDRVKDLAQAIQDAVETWLAGNPACAVEGPVPVSQLSSPRLSAEGAE